MRTGLTNTGYPNDSAAASASRAPMHTRPSGEARPTCAASPLDLLLVERPLDDLVTRQAEADIGLESVPVTRNR